MLLYDSFCEKNTTKEACVSIIHLLLGSLQTRINGSWFVTRPRMASMEPSCRRSLLEEERMPDPQPFRDSRLVVSTRIRQ